MMKTRWSNSMVNVPIQTVRSDLGRALHATTRLLVCASLIGLASFLPAAFGQVPTVLTDKIHKGSGVINLLKNVSAANLQQYLSANGGLLLGVDLNEDLGGNETRNSIGVAIKQLELAITTTAGTFSFRDFFTSTTAMIREAGAANAQEFYTLFGKSGSSAITGGTSGFDLGKFDDVVRLQGVSAQGTILSAQLNVTFLKTANTGTQGNETFFDFSDGFEDFVLLGQKDAVALEAANFGVAGADASVTYTAQTAPGAPAPPLWVMATFGVVMLLMRKRHATV